MPEILRWPGFGTLDCISSSGQTRATTGVACPVPWRYDGSGGHTAHASPGSRPLREIWWRGFGLAGIHGLGR